MSNKATELASFVGAGWDDVPKYEWVNAKLCACGAKFEVRDFGRMAECTSCKGQYPMIAVEKQKRYP